MKLLSLIDIK